MKVEDVVEEIVKDLKWWERPLAKTFKSLTFTIYRKGIKYGLNSK